MMAMLCDDCDPQTEMKNLVNTPELTKAVDG